jgi:hypothetical protein
MYAELHRLHGVFLATIGADDTKIEASFCEAPQSREGAEVDFHWRHAQKQPTRNTAAKKRLHQDDVDFDNPLLITFGTGKIIRLGRVSVVDAHVKRVQRQELPARERWSRISCTIAPNTREQERCARPSGLTSLRTRFF